MTMREWFAEYNYNTRANTIGGTSITEERMDQLESWAEKVKARRNGSQGL